MSERQEFEPVTRERWAARVAEELGVEDADRELLRTTPAGLEARVLYSEADTRTAGGCARAVPENLRPRRGWRPSESIELSVVDFAMEAASASRDGIACVRALGDHRAVDAATQTRLVEAFAKQQGGRRPWLVLRPNTAPLEALGHVDPQRLVLFGGYDPLRVTLADAAAPYDARAAAEAETAAIERFVASGATMPALEIDTSYLREAGAGAVDALAIGLAMAAQRVRAASEVDMSPARWIANVAWRVGVGRDLFEEIAALRALRVCFAKFASAVTGGETGLVHPIVHANGLARELAPVDRANNALRTSSQAFAAAVGGADTLEIQPFESTSSRGRRLARTTHAVLANEAHLDRVDDPAGGAWYVEASTDRFARAAWDAFRSIEAAGGLVVHVESGALVALLEQRRAQMRAAIESGTHAIVGATTYAPADSDEPVERRPPSESVRSGAAPVATGAWPRLEPVVDAEFGAELGVEEETAR